MRATEAMQRIFIFRLSRMMWFQFTLSKWDTLFYEKKVNSNSLVSSTIMILFIAVHSQRSTLAPFPVVPCCVIETMMSLFLGDRYHQFKLESQIDTDLHLHIREHSILSFGLMQLMSCEWHFEQERGMICHPTCDGRRSQTNNPSQIPKPRRQQDQRGDG